MKISDEQKPRKKGEPYQFQIKTHEPSSRLAERINVLYDEQKIKDPEVFTESIKVDDRVLRTVVSHLEAINLNKTDLEYATAFGFTEPEVFAALEECGLGSQKERRIKELQ